jgi:hypothetical protein
MFETDEELDAVDALLASSFSSATGHLTEIMSPERRLSARDLSRYLVGVRHLTVATVTAKGEPRCSAVDGLFLHGHFWFTTSGQSAKAVHLAKRRGVSAAHVIGDDIGIFVHGHVRTVNGGPGEADALRHYWIEVYHSSPEDWVATPDDMRYFEIVPTAMFSYAFSRERFEEMARQASTPEQSNEGS